MTYLVIDTETTSLPDFSLPADAPGQPRVSSLAMILCDDDLRPIVERYHLIKPDGWVMSSEALAINGLTMEKLDAEGVPIAPVLDAYARYIDDGAAVMAYGAQFDVKMLRGEMRREAEQLAIANAKYRELSRVVAGHEDDMLRLNLAIEAARKELGA